MGRQSVEYNMFDSQNSTATSNEIYVEDFRNCVITVSTSGSANGTLEIRGTSIEDETSVDMSSAASEDNPWDTVQVVDLQDGSLVDGDTGISYSGTDSVRQFEVNINALQRIAANLSHAAGSFTVRIKLYSNQ